MMEQIVLSIAEAAAAARISRTKLYELIGAGEVKAIKIGRSTRIVAADLRDWLASLPAVSGRHTKAPPAA
jgi:excisionase family DNA binding protein